MALSRWLRSSTTTGGSIRSREKRFQQGMIRRRTLYDSCNHSYSLAAVLTARRTKFGLPRQLAAGPGGPAGAAVVGDGRRFEMRCRRQQSLVALGTSLNSGDLSGAQEAYLSLTQLQGFANPNGPFAHAMSEIGQALQSGDLAAAQQALSSLGHGRRFRQPS
jgi:hypothetical protein